MHYVYNIFTRICCTLVPKICVHLEMFHVFRYIDMLTSVIYNCMYSKDNWSYTLPAVKIIDEDR